MKLFYKWCVVALVILATGLSSDVQAQVLKTTDVSPDAPFGTPQDSTGMDPSGRILQVVIDPFADSSLFTRTMYAATLYSGVWKSTDGGQSWQQSSVGLRNGLTGGVGPFLATDGFGNLLYVTVPVDGRINQPYGGLWVSIDFAATWHHVDPCGQTEVNTSGNHVYSVAFAQGQPFVNTDCGIVTSQETNLTNPGGWHKISGSLPFLPRNTTLATQSSSLTLFACQGTQVWRATSPLSSSPVWQSVNLPGSCGGQFGLQMAVVPESGFELEPSSVLLVCNLSSGGLEVELVDFDTAPQMQIKPLNFVTVSNEGGCCGTTGVFVAPFRTPSPSGFGPGLSYDVYAADAYHFFRYHADGTWHVLNGLHVDTWSMAFPSTYDPYNGNCTAYSGNDGGLFINQISGVGSCIADGAENGWVQASSGLHLLASTGLTGLSGVADSFACRIVHIDGESCPVLYQSSADDDTWFTSLGGEPNRAWQAFNDALGDSNKVFVDPMLPGVTLAVRNGSYNLRVSNDAFNQPGPPGIDIATPDTAIEIQTPSPGGIAQVVTLPNEAPQPEGDFLAVETLITTPNRTPVGGCAQDTSRNNDVIVRNLTGASAGCHGWFDLAPSANFGPGFVGAIATSGGHAGLTVYVLLSNNPITNYKSFPPGPAGEVWKGQVDSTGHVPFWQNVSGTPPFAINRAYNLFANPYDSGEVWVTDLGDRSVKVTRDGGQTWLGVPELTDVATNQGEFSFSCGSFAFGPTNNPEDQPIALDECSLTGLFFVPGHPEIRVASLYPGGVAFSRDGGHNWIPLGVTHAQASQQPIELPHSAFYDPDSNILNGDTNLYIALEGKGVKRVEGPFPTLEGGLVVFCPACPGGGGPLAGGAQVNVVVGALGTSVPLQVGSDGLYRGTVLFDSAKITSFDYHFDVSGKTTRSFRVNLAPAETATGVTILTNARPPHFRGEIESHSRQASGVVKVGFALTETGEGAAQNVQITGVSFDTIRGKGNVTLDPATAALLPILLGNLAEGGSQTVPLVLDVPASVEKFRMTISGTAQDAIGRSLPFEVTKSLRLSGDPDDDSPNE